jgi:ribosome-associated heat shock protein Hsp15
MSDPASVRLDVWLWRARFFKTRALSAKMCESGHVRLERFGQLTRVDKSSQAVKPGDRLIFAIGSRLIDLEILAIGERRGPAPEAQGLYKLKESGSDTATKPTP